MHLWISHIILRKNFFDPTPIIEWAWWWPDKIKINVHRQDFPSHFWANSIFDTPPPAPPSPMWTEGQGMWKHYLCIIYTLYVHGNKIIIQEGNLNLNCLPPAQNLPMGGGGSLVPTLSTRCATRGRGGGSLIPTLSTRCATRGEWGWGGPKPDFVQNFCRLYLQNWMHHCFQIFTVCRPHIGLPVCWILKPSVLYGRSYGYLCYFHWCSCNF